MWTNLLKAVVLVCVTPLILVILRRQLLVQTIANRRGEWVSVPSSYGHMCESFCGVHPVALNYDNFHMCLQSQLKCFFFILLQSFTTTCFFPYGPSSGGTQHQLNFYGAINATADPLFCDCLDMWCQLLYTYFTVFTI
jgi:hypothetical protein